MIFTTPLILPEFDHDKMINVLNRLTYIKADATRLFPTVFNKRRYMAQKDVPLVW